MTKVLSEWLSYLENRLPQEIDLRLENVRAVAAKLNLLTFDIPIILVAGTNGKGSTVAGLEAIYLAAGYRVGCYTSPHIFCFNERIKINKQPISDLDLCNIFDLIEKSRADIMLTYFETATLACLWYFKHAKLDVIILEVGMGGRLDATNIVNADLSIVTTVDLDHQAYLGNDIETIGYEKAGIFRSNKPCIYADYNPPHSIIDKADVLNAHLLCIGKHYTVTENLQELTVAYNQTQITLRKPRVNYKNAAAAIVASMCLLDKLPTTHQDIITAMENIVVPGRQQLIEGSVTTIYDVAHNPQAVRYLADYLEFAAFSGCVRAVFSAFSDKDLNGLISPMLKYVDFWYPAVMSGKRAANAELLLAAFDAEMGAVPICFSNPVAAYNAALNDSQPGDIIVVYGSFVIVGEVMSSNS